MRNPHLRTACAATAVLAMTAAGLAAAPTAGAAGPYDPYFATPTAALTAAASKSFGVAVGDFTGDSRPDIVSGRAAGQVYLSRGNGDGTYAAATLMPWKQTAYNVTSLAAMDVNNDNKLDVVWAATAATSGCSVSPVPSTGCPSTVSVNDGDVRAFLGNGDGTFQQTPYYVSGVLHNAGVLLADVGTDAGGIAVGNVDGRYAGDGDVRRRRLLPRVDREHHGQADEVAALRWPLG